MKWRAFMVFARLWTDSEGQDHGKVIPKYLGDLEADIEDEALDLARQTWPFPAELSTTTGFTAGHHVEDAAEQDIRIAARKATKSCQKD